jgi:PRD1 phage membrane DNA delivery
MSEQLVSSVTSVLLAIVGVAIIAVLVSKNANTTSVIGAGGSAFAQDLGTAVSPLTGGSLGSFTNLGAGLG